MIVGAFTILLIITIPRSTYARDYMEQYDYIFRFEWKAIPAKKKENLTRPVRFIIFHHTVYPDVCNYTEDCLDYMKYIQKYHQLVKNMDDISYNFVVGGDGIVYEGRGFKRVGQHSGRFDNISLGIAMMGNFTDKTPYECMLKSSSDIVMWGVQKKYIAADFQIFAHRQVAEDTDCPGDTFYEKIQEWDNWRPQVPDNPFETININK